MKNKKRKYIKKNKPNLELLGELDRSLKAVGIAVNVKHKGDTATTYLASDKDLIDPTLEDRKEVIDLVRDLRRREALCSTVGDILKDFVITDGWFETENQQLSDILKSWVKWVNSKFLIPKSLGIVSGLKEFSRKVFEDWLTDGDSVFSIFVKKGVDLPGIDKSFTLPVSIKHHDVKSLEMDEDLSKFGVELIEYIYDRSLKKIIQTPKNDAQKMLVSILPNEWKKAILDNQKIYLVPEVTYHIKRGGKDYRAWGESYFIKALRAVAFKRRLQALDEATIAGMINRLTILILGLEDKEKNPEYYIPLPSRVSALNDLISDPKRTNMLIWPGPDLKAIDIGPDGKVLEMSNKYKQADIDILRALHVPPLLIDGSSSGQSSRDWAAFLSVIAGLEVFRDNLAALFTTIGTDIAIANGFTEVPIWRWQKLALQDERTLKLLVSKVYELGGISIETFVKEMGWDFETEKQRREKEMSGGIDELFTNRRLPFQGKPPAPGDSNSVPASVQAELVGASFVNQSPQLEEIYRSRMKAAFIATRDMVKDSKEVEGIKYKIMGGFIGMKLVSDQLIRVFWTGFSHLSNYNDKYFTKLIGKQSECLFKFQAELISDVEKNFSLSEKKKASLESIFDRHLYRVDQYVREGVNSSYWLSKMKRAELGGKNRVLWVTNKEDSCEKCKENEGKTFSLKEIFEGFPCHPFCKCRLEFSNA